jgi:site-specific DNA-methyltransferase (adenine-specific)
MVKVEIGNCLDILRTLPENSVDSIVTDPPYGLKFMGRRWDYDVPSVEVWAECLRVLRPGGHLLAFAGTRTQHRMCTRIEDAGFEIRDMIAWVYGSGFPKSMDVSKAIDKTDGSATQRENQLRFTAWMRSVGMTAGRINEITGTNMGGHYATAASQPAVATREHFEKLRPHFSKEVPEWVESLIDNRSAESENFKQRKVVGTELMRDISAATLACPYAAQGLDGAPRRRVAITTAHTEAARQWQGWGTALKPAMEPITMARKPLEGTVAANVLAYGTGALNINGCRVGTEGSRTNSSRPNVMRVGVDSGMTKGTETVVRDAGRWPANLILSIPEDEYALRDDVSPSQLRQLAEWMDANP